MNKKQIEVGGIYQLKAKQPAGFEYVQVIEVNGNDIEVAVGSFGRQNGFRLKTFTFQGRPVRRATLKASDIANFIEKGEYEMSNKTKDAGTGETHVELDEDVAVEATSEEGETGTAKKPMTAAEKIAAIKKAEADKIAAIKAKEKAKEQAQLDRKVGKVAEAAKKAEVKEADAAEQYSGGRTKKFADLTDSEIKAAIEGLKQTAKDNAKKQRESESAAKKLAAAAEKAGVKEAEVAQQYSEGRTKKLVELTPEEVAAALEGLKQRAKDKAAADKLALKTTLTDEEAASLKSFEKIVEKNLANYQQAGFLIGGALQGINQGKLYRATHKTFEAYVADRFGLSRPHAYSVMTAAVTFAALTENIEVDVKQLPSITAAEAITRGVKGLLKETGLDADAEVDAITRRMARNVYEIAVQNAPQDKDGKPILSPGHLESTFNVLSDVARAGVVEIDGQQVPINLAATAIDEMITTESHERVQRMKANLAERIGAMETAAREAKPSKLDAALNSATGNGSPIPEGVTPKLTVVCSVHGRNQLEESSDTDVKLGCGCVFVSTPEGYMFEKNTVA